MEVSSSANRLAPILGIQLTRNPVAPQLWLHCHSLGYCEFIETLMLPDGVWNYSAHRPEIVVEFKVFLYFFAPV